MSDATITTIDELREHMGHGADGLNILLATSVGAFDAEGEEQLYLSHATQFQIEGYVLHPRHIRAVPVELVLDDPEDARYVLHLVRSSQAPLAARQAQALHYGSQSAVEEWPTLPKTMQPWQRVFGLGGAID